ncbi:MAG: hypothetical protein HQK49_04355 [Oligoflexia bacterium]|nr:hypothetical protein [Oligoflexia bacterium]
MSVSNLFIFFILLIFATITSIASASASASLANIYNTYLCNINLIQAKQEVAVENIDKFVERFTFENKGEGSGVKQKFQDIEMFIWNQKKNLYLLVKDLKKKIEVQSIFAENQDNLFIKLSAPDIKVQCMTMSRWEKLEDEQVKALFLLPSLNDNSKLLNYTNNISVVINKDITFKYSGSQGAGGGASAERMAEVFFQTGRLLPSNVSKDDEHDWCIFQIQRKMDEDTIVPRETRIPVVTVTRVEASKEHYSFNYNFVDFVDAKKGFETFDFVPFVLKCKIKNGVVLTKKYFKEITGNYFDVKK